MQPRKKILLVITKSNWGGAQQYVHQIASSLDPDKFDTVVACGGSGMLVEHLSATGVRVASVPGLGRDVRIFGDLRAAWELLRLYIREKPDVIHLNSNKAGTMGAVMAFLYKLIMLNVHSRVIFTVHGWAFHEDRNALARFVIFAAHWIAALFHDVVIVLSRHDYASGAAFIRRSKLALIPLGISAPSLHPRRHARQFFAARANTSFPDSTFVVGTIAELTRNKGLIYLIHALKQIAASLPSFHAIIIGEGEQRKTLEALIATHGLEARVTLAGFIPQANAYLSGFDLFILPSVKEGLPYAVIEAMAAGLPIVATNVGGVSELLEHGQCGIIVPPKHPARLASSLARLASDPELRHALGTRSKERIAERYSHDRMISEIISLYSL